MKTLVIDEKYRGLRKDEYGQFLFQGNIECDGAIEINLDSWLIVSGSIWAGRGIKASGGIKAGWGIEAGGGIEAGEDIEAGWGIKAGEDIGAGWDIKAGWGIEAGEGIGAGGDIEAGLTIKCKQKLSSKCRIFAGVFTQKKTLPEEQVIECAEIDGVIGFGILKKIEA